MTRDLMFTDEIQALVADAYRALEGDSGHAAAFYSEEQLRRLPPAVHGWLLGVGNPLPHADLRPGEVVADLGCGAGGDTLLAAAEVAPEGRAIGVDMLPEMVERAQGFAAEAGQTNAEFRLGQMEALPLDDASIDVVISNGSVNLAARKSRVLAEAFRVLRPGGRLAVADLTIQEEDLPVEVLTHPSAWAG